MSVLKIKVQEDSDSPTLDYTFSDDSGSDNEDPLKIVKKKVEPILSHPVATLQKPPRPVRSYANSEINSPRSLNTSPYEPLNREATNFASNQYIKPVKKIRCSSVGDRSEENTVLKCEIRGKVLEIELKQWEDPIKVAHSFSVKNNIRGIERNNIALMLTKLQKNRDKMS